MLALRKLLFAIVLGSTSMVGCGPAHVQVAADFTPRLVWIDPGLWVVEDHPYAVYYADGYYWRHYDGVWYRSSYYDGGFVRMDIGIVPRIVIGAYRPAHVRYRAPAQVHVRPIVRDHRSPAPRRR
jgi:hypothetical protein